MRLKAPARPTLAGLRRWLVLWAITAAVGVIPVLATWLRNRYQVSAADLVLPILLVLLTATLIAVAFGPVWRRKRLAALLGAATVSLFVSSNYDDRFAQARDLVGSPAWADGKLGSLLLLFLVGAAGYGLGWGASRLLRWRGWSEREAIKTAVVVTAVTLVLQLVPVTTALAAAWPQFSYRPAAWPTLPTAKTAEKPDIFYIVLDRYTNTDTLKREFGYDNAEFIAFLERSGYYVDSGAHNNYPYTAMSIAATMQADYLNDPIARFGSGPQTIVPYQNIIRHSPVVTALRDAGYKYHLVGNWYETSNTSPLADHTDQGNNRLTLFGRDYILDNFPKDVMTQHPLFRFVQDGVRVDGRQIFGFGNLGDAEMTRFQLEALRRLAAEPAGGRLVFAHLLVPHDPFVFMADGSPQPDSGTNNNGLPIKQKYLEQVKYINSQMQPILEQINTQSQGKAVVILQADEGPYPQQVLENRFEFEDIDQDILKGDMTKWSDAALQMKFGNLAAYRIPAANFPADAEAADTINVFRLVANSYFGAGLPYRPDCYYAFPQGRDKAMTYSSVTERVSGQPEDPRCQPNGSVGK